MRNFYKIISALAFCLSAFLIQAQNTNQESSCPGIPGACGYPSVNTPPDKNNPNPLNGNGSLGQIYNVNKCGLNYVQATLRLGKRLPQPGVNQPATFVITGLPTCRVIERAYIYSSMSGTAMAFNVTVTNPLLVTNNYPAVLIGSGPDKCWGYGGTTSYRVDVTAAISGNGNYVISGFPTNPPTPQKDTDGATLFIIYSDPTANYEGHMVIHDGCVIGIGGNQTQTLTGINACANSTYARAFCMTGDWQLAGITGNWNGTPVNIPWNWWNYDEVATTVTAGQANAVYSQFGTNDCYNWVVMGLYYRTTTCTTCPQSLALTITPTIVQPTCSSCNGSISVVVTGGGPPYTYSWAPGNQTTSSLTGLCPGTYTLYVTDASCNQTSQVFTLTSSGALVTTQSQTNVLCNGQCTGSATVTATGGNPPYTYVWTPNVGNTATVNNLCAGSYSCLVTSSNGCTAIVNFTITQPPPITLTQTQVNVTCNNLCNGTATVTASGGTPGYTYTWSTVPVQYTQTATGLCAGSYTVTVKDANGCTQTLTYTITQPPALTVTASATPVSCFGGTNGTVSSSASGGTPAYAYLWTPGNLAGANQINLPAGTYTVTVTDANGCTAQAIVTITQPTQLAATQSQVNVLCNGQCTGTATVVASGGTPGYTYNWLPTGQTTPTATGLCAGTYTCTITDANGCTITRIFTITQPPALTLSTSFTQSTCGNPNGSATVTASGGTPAYTYLWSNGATTATISNITAGSYTIVVTDANGCTATATVVVPNAGAPTVTITSFTNVSCFGGSNGTATATATGGTPGYTYLWSNAQTGANATGLPAGTYTVVVTDANGCSAQTTVTITQPTLLTATSSQVNATCFNLCNGTATVVASGGTPAYSYNWTPSGGNAATATGLCAGNYTCTITDANGCTVTQTFTITQPTAVVATATSTPVACFGGSNGTVSATASGGTPGYTYTWNPGNLVGANQSNLPAGTYTVTVTDANGCTATATVTITQPTLLTVTIPTSTNVSCNGGNNGSATAAASGGTPAYTYLWSNSQTSASATGLIAGTYTVVVTDANGCTAQATITITQPTPLVLTTSFVQSTCGNPNGSATVVASGGTPAYTYLWSNGGTTATISNIAANTYTVIVTDANGCTATTTVTVTNAGSPTVTVTASTNVLCFGGNNGSATATATGGTPGYTYLWNPTGQTSATATGLTAGTYTITVTDANGCSSTATITITQPTQLTVTATSTPVACFGGSTGTISATAGGGTPLYAYLWQPGNMAGANQNNLPAGTYTVTVTDANGCTVQTTVVITQPTLLTASVPTSSPVLCNGGNTGSATAAGAGGTPAYSYSWSNSQTGANATGLSAGTYTVYVTDANGCTAQATVTITQPTAVTLTTSFIQATCGNANGSASVTATGGTPGYTYLWSNGATTATINNVTSNIYSVVVTDANGCTATASVNVPNAGSPTVTISASTNVSCFGGSNGTATATATGGTPGYTFVWSNSQTGANTTGLSAGTYTVTVTDANGCSAQTTVTITQPTQLVVTATGTNVLCNAGNSGSATSSATGATPPYTYLWSNGQPTQNATGLIAGTYTIVVTDANGCTAQTTVVIAEPTALTIAAQGFAESCFGSCNGQVVTIPGGGTTPYTYLWSSGCVTPGCVNVCAGTYTIVVTDANGCTIQDTANVASPPALVATATMTQALCGNANGTATVVATGGVGTYTYLWNNSQTGATATGLVPNTYTVTVTDANGCTTTATVTVTTPNPLTSTATSTNLLCFGDLSGTASVTASGGTTPYTYLWNTSATTSSVSNLSVGTYTVVITDANGCTTSSTVTITQPAQLVATASVSTAICFGVSTQIGGFGTGGTSPLSYVWLPGGPGQNLTVSPNGTTTYVLIVTDANGCTDSASTTITVNPLPVFVVSADDSAGCVTHCVTFTPSITTGTFSWTYGDGNTGNTSSPNHCYTTIGAFTVGLTITDLNGCSSTISVNQMINVYPLPVADFTMSTESSSVLDPEVCFTNTSVGATIYSWDFGDPSSTSNNSSLQNPCHTYSDTGTFCITLWVENANGCRDSIQYCVTITPDFTFYAPNSFTPDGDGTNDDWYPQGTGWDINTYQLYIFDRWGNMIFSTDNVNKRWDGIVQGHTELVQEDTYVWKVVLKDFQGNQHQYVGHVSVIR